MAVSLVHEYKTTSWICKLIIKIVIWSCCFVIELLKDRPISLNGKPLKFSSWVPLKVPKNITTTSIFGYYAAHTLAWTFEAKSNWKVFSKKFLIKNALWIHWKSSSENQIFFGIAHLLRIGTKFHFLHVSKETFKKEKNFYSKAEQNWPKLPCLWLYDKWIFLEKTLDNLCHSFGKEISAKSFWRKVIAIS